MGQTAATLRASLENLGIRQKSVLLCGPNGAGKTCLLYGLKLGFDYELHTIPTIGFNVETIRHKAQDFTIWDLGLRSKARPLVRHYVPGMAAVIFMINAQDREFFEDAEDLFQILRHAMEEHGCTSVPCLFYINMHSLGPPGKAMSTSEICDRLKLDDVAKVSRVHLQHCDAKSGQGVKEGLDFIATARPNDFGLTIAESSTSSPGGGYAARDAPDDDPAAAAAEPRELVGPRDADALTDPEFLECFKDQSLKSFGPKEMMRLSLLQRPNGSALASLEAARLKGYVQHASRMHFWAARAYAARIPERLDTRNFLSEHEELLPASKEQQEALLRGAYSEKIDTEPTWAITVMPPDLHEDDEAFLTRMEGLRNYHGELDSFASLVRLAFALLKSSPRREAIRRMDQLLRRLETSGRPFHETRQYVALQLAHLALAQHALHSQPFARLQALRPELCEESILKTYYSEAALARGRASFVVPDVEPLPTKLELPPTWHEELDDQEFLRAVKAQSLSSWPLPGLARLAYIHLAQLGRRGAVQELLKELQELRRSPEVQAGPFAHETLAYFTLHMVHYFASAKGISLTTPFGDFVSSCEEILDASLYRAFYSEEQMHCREARTSLVLPDLCPLPDLLPST